MLKFRNYPYFSGMSYDVLHRLLKQFARVLKGFFLQMHGNQMVKGNTDIRDYIPPPLPSPHAMCGSNKTNINCVLKQNT